MIELEFHRSMGTSILKFFKIKFGKFGEIINISD